MILAKLLVAVVALQHIFFMILEMFLWTKPLGLKVFRQSFEKAESQKVLAANQGLYNGFLAAGLIWGLLHPNLFMGFQIQMFFLGCVFIAGVFGGQTFSTRIFYVQALPALLAALLLWFGV